MRKLLASTAIAGLLTLPAFAQAVETPAAPDAGAAATTPAMPGGEWFALYDLNADGMIDAADLTLADTNADGKLDATDEPQFAEGMDPAAPPAPGPDVFAVYDLNADGFIDDADFLLADTNTDGVIDSNDEPQFAEGMEPAPAGDAPMETAEGAEADPDAVTEPVTDMAAGDATVAPEAGAAPETEVAEGADATVAPEAGAAPETEVAEGADATVPPAATVDMAAVDITGERVYDANDEWIGEVGEIVVADGKSWAIIDVGGFLGIGEKPVALDLEELDITDVEGDVRVSVVYSKEQLEAMPTYEAPAATGG